MTVMRWTALTAACAAGLAAVALLAGERAASPRDAQATAAEKQIDRLFARARAAEEKLYRVTLRDSLRGVLRGREWPADSLLVLADPLVPAWRADLEATRARRMWAAAGPMRGGVRVAYVVSLAGKNHAWRAGAMLPEAIDGRTCVAIRHVTMGEMSSEDRNNAVADSNLSPTAATAAVAGSYYSTLWQNGDGLGPCAFFAAFGPPGPKIRAWLDSVEFHHATTPNFWSPPDAMPPWYALRWEGTSAAGLNNGFLAIVDVMLASPSGPDNAAIVHCASGDVSACRPIVLGAGERSDPNRDPAEIGLPQPIGWYLAYGYVGERLYRDFRPRLLADLVRDVGHDRFKAIWTSPKAFDEAYTDATGTPFVTGMADYVRRSVGGGALIGPSLPPRPVVSAIVIVLVLMASMASRFTAREHR